MLSRAFFRAVRSSPDTCISYLFRDEGRGYAGGMIDLKDASREALIRLVGAQHETIQQQERIIADLHAEGRAIERAGDGLDGVGRHADRRAGNSDALGRRDGERTRAGDARSHARACAGGCIEARAWGSVGGDGGGGGEECAGVVVSDVYAGYAPHDGVKQQCWAHLVRDGHDLRGAYPKDAAVQAWAAGVQDVYTQAVACRCRSGC